MRPTKASGPLVGGEMGIRRALSKICTLYDREPKGCPWKGAAVPRERVPASLRALYDHFGAHRRIIKSRAGRLFLPDELTVAEDGVAFADNGSKDYTYLYRKGPGSRKYAVYHTNGIEGGPRHRECDLDTFLVHFAGWMLCNTIWASVTHVRLSRKIVNVLPSIAETTATSLLGFKSDCAREVIFNEKYIFFILLDRKEGFIGHTGTTLSDVAERYPITDVI